MPEHRLKVCERSSRRQKCIFSSGDFDSAQSPCYIYYYYRCLNLSKAHSIPPPVISTPLNHRCYIYCYSRCLSLSKAQSHSYSLWFRLPSITVLYLLLLSVPEPVEGTFSLIIPVISTSSITVLYLLLLSVPELVEGTFSLIFSVISAPLNHRVIFITTLGAWACRRHVLTHHLCDFGSAQSPVLCFHPRSLNRCLSLSKAELLFQVGAWACRRHNISILIRIIFW